MIELMNYIADGVESFFKWILRGILMFIIVVTSPVWVLPYLIIRKYL